MSYIIYITLILFNVFNAAYMHSQGKHGLAMLAAFATGWVAALLFVTIYEEIRK